MSTIATQFDIPCNPQKQYREKPLMWSPRCHHVRSVSSNASKCVGGGSFPPVSKPHQLGRDDRSSPHCRMCKLEATRCCKQHHGSLPQAVPRAFGATHTWMRVLFHRMVSYYVAQGAVTLRKTYQEGVSLRASRPLQHPATFIIQAASERSRYTAVLIKLSWCGEGTIRNRPHDERGAGLVHLQQPE